MMAKILVDTDGQLLSKKIMGFAAAVKKPKILLPGSQNRNKTEVINAFLKGWLTEKQYESCGGYYREMLEAFSREMTLFTAVNDFTSMKMRRISASPVSEPADQKFKVDLEEIDGDLKSGVKLIPVSLSKDSDEKEVAAADVEMDGVGDNGLDGSDVGQGGAMGSWSER